MALGTGGLLAGAPAAHAALGDTTTIAGSALGFVDGTGLGIAGTTQFRNPRGVAVDTAGNLYVADTGNHRIRKITLSTGQTTTIAGNGTAGFFDGTGGPTGTTQFNLPNSVAVDTNGVIYVGDRLNNRVRRIAIDGTTTTLAGNGTPGYVDGTGGPSGTTEFNRPNGVAVDANGIVYVADTTNNRIRKIAVDGTTTTLAGGTGPRSNNDDGTGGPTGTARFDGPAGIAIDAGGIVYVADLFGRRIRKVGVDGTTTTLAGNGTLGSLDGTGGFSGTTQFSGPNAVAVDANGMVYVADTSNHRIRKIAPDGTTTTLAGTGTVGSFDGTGGSEGTTQFFSPGGVAVDTNGNVYVAEINNHRIRKISGPLAPPTVTANTTLAYANDTALTVTGTGFDASTPPNNTVTLSSGATGTVTAATTTSLTVMFGTKPVAGPLTVIVTNSAGNSGAAVQVASVFPVITSNTATVIAPSASLTINGFGFSPTPGNNTVSLSSGSGIVTAATPTQLTLTGVTGLTLGALTAVVTTNSQSSGVPVQIATVVAGPAALMNATAGSTPQTALVNAQFTNPLAVTIADTLGNPISGVSVTLTAPPTGASAVFSNATQIITDITNATGVVSAPFSANSIGGTYTVTATVTSPTGITNIDFTLMNTKASQTVSYTSATPTPRVGATYTPTATASSNLPVTITADPSSSSVCTLSGGVVSFNAAGTCTLNANQPGNQTFLPGTQTQQTITITAPPTTTTTSTTTTTTTAATQLVFPALTSGTPSTQQATTGSTGSGTGTGGTTSATPTATTPGTSANTPAGGNAPTNSGPTTGTNGGTNVTTTTQPAPAPATPTGTPSDTAKQFDPAGVFTINFAPRATSLSKTSKATITKVAATYKTLPNATKIVISAHTGKTASKNDRDLATKRANTVSKALKTALGKTVTTNGLRITVDTKTDNPTTPTVAQTNRVTIQTTK